MTPWHRAMREARVAIARLELVSNGTVAAMNSGGGGHPGSKPPPPAGADWERLRECLRVARTVDELDRIRVAADNAWVAATGRGTADRDRGEGVTDSQLVLEAVGHDAEAVAWRFSWDVARVRRHRERNDQDPETGRPKAVAKAEADQRDEDWRQSRVVELERRGLTEQQIGAATGLSKRRVRRMLGRAA